MFNQFFPIESLLSFSKTSQSEKQTGKAANSPCKPYNGTRVIGDLVGPPRTEVGSQPQRPSRDGQAIGDQGSNIFYFRNLMGQSLASEDAGNKARERGEM